MSTSIFCILTSFTTIKISSNGQDHQYLSQAAILPLYTCILCGYYLSYSPAQIPREVSLLKTSRNPPRVTTKTLRLRKNQEFQIYQCCVFALMSLLLCGAFQVLFCESITQLKRDNVAISMRQNFLSFTPFHMHRCRATREVCLASGRISSLLFHK